jgi:MFS family permease
MRAMTEFRSGVWGSRYLNHYPDNALRIWYLTVSVLVTIILYYEYYVLGAVAPLVLPQLKMSLNFYAYMWVVANGLGALSSIIGGVADRVGRSRFVVWGLLASAAATLALAYTDTLWSFSIVFSILGFVEGVLLVATPALVRDFSPRLGRATAMAFWTIGPAGGSLLTTFFANQTLPVFHTWQSQYIIAGIIGFAVFLISLFGLKELSPEIRNQIMISLKERALLEAKARGIRSEELQNASWKQMMRPKLFGSAFAISVFLLIYYSAVGYLPLYLSTIFKFSLTQSTGMMTIYWVIDVIALVVIGVISDRTEVRKPYMIVGALGAIVALRMFIAQIGQPTSFGTMTFLLSFLAVMISIAYVPWMASYTETVEDVNPALVATGIALWGSLIRWVVVIQGLFIMHVIGPPQGWATWWKVCMGGVIVFIPFVFTMSGYWTTRKAQEARMGLARKLQMEIAGTAEEHM